MVTRKKVSELTEVTSIADSDLIYVVKDITGTLTSAKMQRSNFLAGSAVGTFSGLTDVTGAYTTANAIYKVNSTPDGLEETTTLLTEPAANQFQIARGTSALLVQGDLTVEGNSVINQDLTTDASPTFAGSTLTGFAGVVQATAGVLSASTALADGTTATTQSSGDNSTKVATTAYVDGAIPVFGTEAQYSSDDTETSTTSSTYQQKVRLTTPTLPAGTYRIGWSIELNIDDENSDIQTRVQIDDTTTINEEDGRNPDRDLYYIRSGFIETSLTNASHTIDLDYNNQSGKTIYARRARIEIWRIS